MKVIGMLLKKLKMKHFFNLNGRKLPLTSATMKPISERPNKAVSRKSETMGKSNHIPSGNQRANRQTFHSIKHIKAIPCLKGFVCDLIGGRSRTMANKVL